MAKWTLNNRKVERVSNMDNKKYDDLVPLVTKFLKDLIEYWGISNPVELLCDCIAKKEWFKGIVLSTAFFEVIGKKLLIDYFKCKIEAKKIKHIQSVEQIIVLLHASGIIDQPTYTKMIEVNDLRNSLVHPTEPYSQKLSGEEAEKNIQKAIDCLLSLVRPKFESPEELDKFISKTN